MYMYIQLTMDIHAWFKYIITIKFCHVFLIRYIDKHVKIHNQMYLSDVQKVQFPCVVD